MGAPSPSPLPHPGLLGPARRQRPPAAEEVRVRVPADLDALAPVRRGLAGALERRGWVDGSATRVLMAADEAVANAVTHGSCPGAEVEMAFRVDGEESWVVVLDCGGPRGERPALPGPAPPEVTATHGRGLLLMCALCDRLNVEAYGPGTRVEMRFSRDEGALAA